MNREEKIEDGLFYHVYNRGNDRKRIFCDGSDYQAFIEKIKSLAQKYSIDVPIYTLMPNHYHMLVRQNARGSLSDMMGALATSAAKRYNLKYGHIGHLFQGPYRNVLVPEEAIQDVACYIHFNPVRARLVKKPEEWKYSNFAELVEGYLPPSLKREEGNLLQGYAEYVRQVLKDEYIERKYWKRVKVHIEGFL
jgi:REP element-mobilizing transposase RayT